MQTSKEVNDKILEHDRFEKRAEKLLNQNLLEISIFGADSVPHYLRTPYDFYEKKLSQIIKTDWKLLELGSGTGVHTQTLVKSGANVIASDISKNSLKILKNTFKNKSNLKTVQADIEKLPFKDESFDLVACAGALSYGNSFKVDKEIRRVLRPGGVFICVDSLNDNLIYKTNRYFHYLKGGRSKITLQNMPSYKRIEIIKKKYSTVEVKYFGSISYIMPLFSLIFGYKKSKKISDFIDRIFNIKKSAFKFVLIAKTQ